MFIRFIDVHLCIEMFYFGLSMVFTEYDSWAMGKTYGPYAKNVALVSENVLFEAPWLFG